MKKARLAAGLSREKAAVKLGVHRNSVNNWERGQMPKEDAVKALCALYPDLAPDLFAVVPLQEFEQSVLQELSEMSKRLTPA